jgi:hypothetical protein
MSTIGSATSNNPSQLQALSQNYGVNKIQPGGHNNNNNNVNPADNNGAGSKTTTAPTVNTAGETIGSLLNVQA